MIFGESMAQRVKLEEEGQPIQVTILGKHLDLTAPIKQYIMEKVEKVEKINHMIMEIAVRIDVQKLDHSVDIVMKFSHFKITVHAVTTEMYSAIDKAFDRLKAKIRKWKGRIQDHQAKGIAVIDLQINVLEKSPTELEEINDEIEEENLKEVEAELEVPKVYKKKTRSLKTLTLDEAVMKLELCDDHFLIYRSQEELCLKVLYRRRDGSYGVIDLPKES